MAIKLLLSCERKVRGRLEGSIWEEDLNKIHYMHASIFKPKIKLKIK